MFHFTVTGKMFFSVWIISL